MENISRIVHELHKILWGPWTLVLFLGVGIFYTVKLKFFQITHFTYWLRETLGTLFAGGGKEEKEGKGISKFQSLCTSLAATLGTGNIAGVATALVAGGPGAVFWMWVSATVGMMTTYAENYLGIKYRYRDKQGEWMGGAMVYISEGLGMKRAAAAFCLFCILASFGMGNMAQSNSISTALWDTWQVSPWITGGVLCALTGVVILGGVKRIASVSEKIIPVSSVIYILFSIIVIGKNVSALLPVLQRIFKEAFTFSAVSGGAAGYGITVAIKYGVARGVFSNEAGLGSTVMIHASAEDTTPKIQGMWGILEVWIDTIVMCTVTALVILCSGAYDANPGLNGASLSVSAFDTILWGFGQSFIMASMAVFAFATLIGWSYMGAKCTEYLFGKKRVRGYRILFLVMILLGSLIKLELVWELSDVFNGLMAIPNLMALVLLSREVKV